MYIFFFFPNVYSANARTTNQANTFEKKGNKKTHRRENEKNSIN